MLSIFLTDVSGALCIKHSESFPDLVVRVLLSHLPENNQEEKQPIIRGNNLYMRTQNSSHSTASLPSTSTWSHNNCSADITHLKPHLINRVLQLGLGGVLSQRSHHLGELLTNVTNVGITSLSPSLTFVLMLPSPFLSNSLKADLNTLFSSSVMLARMARLSSSVTAWIRPLLIMSVSRGIQ